MVNCLAHIFLSKEAALLVDEKSSCTCCTCHLVFAKTLELTTTADMTAHCMISDYYYLC